MLELIPCADSNLHFRKGSELIGFYLFVKDEIETQRKKLACHQSQFSLITNAEMRTQNSQLQTAPQSFTIPGIVSN